MPRITLAVSNFARWFIGVLGRESPIYGELCSPRSSISVEVDAFATSTFDLQNLIRSPEAAIEYLLSFIENAQAVRDISW